MLMFAVLDPLAFEKDNFDNPAYSLQIKIFLKGVLSNGVLILDPNSQLKEKIMSLIEVVPIKYRQQVNILLEEIFIKNKKRKTICCHQKAFSNKNISDLREIVAVIKDHCSLDAIITNQKGNLYLATKGISVSDVVTLESYDESSFEEKRKRFFEEMPSMDSLPIEEFNEVIIRIVKFARWIRFFDPYIGKGTNVQSFYKGIEHILNLWNDYGYFISQNNLLVEIIASDVMDDDRRPIEAIKNGYEIVESQLLKKLKRKFPEFKIELSIKDDTKTRIMHARYLQTQISNIQFDPGFDIFSNLNNSDKELRRLLVKIDNGGSEHLKECRQLPEIISTTNKNSSTES